MPSASLSGGVRPILRWRLRTAIGLARQTGNTRWLIRLEILSAVQDGDGARVMRAIEHARISGQLAITDMAEVIVEGLPLLNRVPDAVRDSATRWPARWLPLFRRTVAKGYCQAALASARALDELGILADVPLLRAFDRTYSRLPAVGFG